MIVGDRSTPLRLKIVEIYLTLAHSLCRVDNPAEAQVAKVDWADWLYSLFEVRLTVSYRAVAAKQLVAGQVEDRKVSPAKFADLPSSTNLPQA